METSTWERLHISNEDSQTPSLFFKTSFQDRGYAIFVTDLSRLWSEELGEQAITDHGTAADTHFERIDQSNFPDLLETIASSLKHADETSHTILPNGDSLILHTKLALPEPLDPFDWKFHLNVLPPEGVSRHLTLPLLTSSFALRNQINDLVHSLREKDKVISKLLDQLESINVDLTTVFPSLTILRGSKKTIKREQAARHVPGLQCIDEDEWRSSSRPRADAVSPMDEVMLHLRTDSGPASMSGIHVEWWTELKEATISRAIPTFRPTQPTIKEDETTETEDEDGEFQRQATPPHLKASLPHKNRMPEPRFISTSNHVPEDGETTENDLDAPRKLIKQEPLSQSQYTHVSQPYSGTQVSEVQPAASKARSRFTIGNSKTLQTPEAAPDPAHGEDIASSHDTSLVESSTSVKSTAPAPVAPKPTRSRFKIGGKKEELATTRTVTLSRTTDQHAAVDRSINTTHSAASRIKTQGTKIHSPPTTTASEKEVDLRKSPSPEAETADDIAERRRRELKRQLETKAPTKKKRRL